MSEKLTHRERDILERAAFGQSAKEIASDAGISIDTVETHLKNIKEKTHLQKTTELSVVYMACHYHIPVIDIPERFRRAIATAMLCLTVFTFALNTSPLLRIFTGNGRPGAKTVNTNPGTARARRNEFQLAI